MTEIHTYPGRLYLTLRGRARRGAAASPWRCLHATPHLVECAAMVYMFVLPPGPFGSPAGSRFSFLSLPLALFLLGYVVWLGDRLAVRAPALALRLPGQRPAVPAYLAAARYETSASPAAGASPVSCVGAASGRPLLAPRCAVLCKIAMGVTMGYMLIMML